MSDTSAFKQFFIINLIVFAILLPDIRIWTLEIALVFLGYTIVLFFDKRKSEWTLGSIILRIIIFLTVSIGYIFAFKLYFCLIVIGTEITISGLIFYICNLLKDKISK